MLPAEQSIDIRFADFMADEQRTLRAVYDIADQPYDDQARAAMADFMSSHPRGRHGEVIYDMADLGLDAADVGRRLAAYRDRFVLP